MYHVDLCSLLCKSIYTKSFQIFFSTNATISKRYFCVFKEEFSQSRNQIVTLLLIIYLTDAAFFSIIRCV